MASISTMLRSIPPVLIPFQSTKYLVCLWMHCNSKMPITEYVWGPNITHVGVHSWGANMLQKTNFK